MITVFKVQRSTFINYCSIFEGHSDQCVFIDPAWELDKFELYLKDNKRDLVAILLTHHHYDHCHLANKLALKYNVPVYMSQMEVRFYRFHCANLNVIYPWQHQLMLHGLSPIQIYHTPGHTFGGICYQYHDALVTGDTLFNEGCGFCKDKGSSAALLYESLMMLKKTLPGEIRIFPGHRFKSELGLRFDALLKRNIYLNIEDKEAFIRFRTRGDGDYKFV